MSSGALSRRQLLILALTARAHASGSDFWNRKPPADWTPEEIARLLSDSPWARGITPTYTSLPPPEDHRPWSETPPIGRGTIPPARQRQVKAPYRAIVRWESAEPIRTALKTALPPAFGGHYVLGIFFQNSVARDLGSKPLEHLKQSAILLGNRPVRAEVVQAHPQSMDGFLVGFPRIATRVSTNGAKQLEFSAHVGFLALKAKFSPGDMLYHGQLAL